MCRVQLHPLQQQQQQSQPQHQRRTESAPAVQSHWNSSSCCSTNRSGSSCRAATAATFCGASCKWLGLPASCWLSGKLLSTAAVGQLLQPWCQLLLLMAAAGGCYTFVSIAGVPGGC